MSFKSTVLAASAAVLMAFPALASGIEVHDPYARSSSAMATSGGIFMVIHNHGGPDDRLIGASSDVAEKVELHTHSEDANGVMRMIHVEEGFEIPTDGEIVMERGGHHVMLLGLSRPLEQGDVIDLVLTFETAGDVAVQVPVDLERQPEHGGHGGGHGHGHGGHGAATQD